MLIESLVLMLAGAIYANVTVPVVPDPNYLEQLYPSTPTPQQQFDQQLPLQAPNIPNGNAQPMDIGTIVSLVVTAGLGYLFQRQKTTTDRRTYMAADTSLKLAQNDQASDAKLVDLTYAVSCMADIMGKYHREEMETYQTVGGVSIWTFIENLNTNFGKEFEDKYINKPDIPTTGTQSKDKVVSTFNQVQSMVTPTPSSTTKPESVSSTVIQPNRTATNKQSIDETAKQNKTPA